MRKKTLIIGGGAVVVLGILAYLYFVKGGSVKTAIEKVRAKITGATITDVHVATAAEMAANPNYAIAAAQAASFAGKTLYVDPKLVGANI